MAKQSGLYENVLFASNQGRKNNKEMDAHLFKLISCLLLLSLLICWELKLSIISNFSVSFH